MRRSALALLTLLAIIGLSTAPPLRAAVGCTLNDPDRDVLRIFPTATNYRTDFIAIAERGGEELAFRLESFLGDSLDPVYETLDVPYAYYTVLAGSDTIGRVHGVNQRGEYGGMQIILATDAQGAIIEAFYQRLSSPHAKLLRSDSFLTSFVGLDIGDFCRLNETGDGPAADIEDPTGGVTPDFRGTLRGVAKNLFLLGAFHFDATCPPDTEGSGS